MKLQKKISRNLLLLTMIAVLLTVLLFVFQLDRYLQVSVKDEMAKARITAIDQDGVVLYDNYVRPENMDNHLSRPEIQEAFQDGFGQSERYSDTLGKQTYYFATRISDQQVLRLSITTDSLLGMLLELLPMLLLIVCVVMLLSLYFSRYLSRNILAPINAISFEGEPCEPYDELSPFLHKIQRQRDEISKQMTALENSNRTIGTITENMREGLLLLDSKETVLSVNKSAALLFDRSSVDCMGKNLWELTRNTRLAEHIRKGLSGQEGNFVQDLQGRNYHVFVSPVVGNGAMVLFLDVSESMRAEKMRREFSANVSHELKTPLTTISGYGEMIASGMVQAEDIPGFAGKIREEAARLIALIEDIIKLSELDEGGISQNFEYCPLSTFVAEVAERLQTFALERDVTLNCQIPAITLWAQPQMLSELLFNLMENAIKYNVLGGSVTVFAAPDGDKVNISVTDTGIGIPKEHLERIFERFYRIDKSRSKKTGGTGLGLSIVKHIVEYHGGHMETSSEVGKGTCISVWL